MSIQAVCSTASMGLSVLQCLYWLSFPSCLQAVSHCLRRLFHRVYADCVPLCCLCPTVSMEAVCSHFESTQILCSTVSMQCSTVSIWCSTISIQCSTISIQCSTISIQCSTISMQALCGTVSILPLFSTVSITGYMFRCVYSNSMCHCLFGLFRRCVQPCSHSP